MAFCLIMPGTIRGAGFHGREDVDQAGLITPLSNDSLDPVFLTKGFVATDELDLYAASMASCSAWSRNSFNK